MKREQLDKLTEYVIVTLWDAGFLPASGGQGKPSDRAKELYAELTADDTEERWPAPLGEDRPWPSGGLAGPGKV